MLFVNACLRLCRRYRRLLRYGALSLAAIALLGLGSVAIGLAVEIPGSNYAIAQSQPFNQVASYLVQPLPTSPTLRPNGVWSGRLILPSEQDYANDPGDWAWFEVWHGAEGNPDVVGQVVKLTWKSTEANDRYVATVTKDITFSQQAENFLANGNVVPVRLNGRQQVGPLQSLAGARPQDDVTVRLVDGELTTEGGTPVLQTGLEPVQITGREYGLVKILGPDTTVNAPLPTECPGPAPCPGEFFRVQFYDPASQAFSGLTGTVRIPQQPMVNGERFFSNLRDLENSPAGEAGWYIYGARDAEGMFTVQALKPRKLFQLQPDQVVIGEDPGLKYIDRENWRDTPQRKGTLQRVLVSPDGGSSDAARARWAEGDYALVIHLFGGIGGENKEFAPAGTVTGHFAYGLARVVREPITNELQFNIQYQQIYAHNSGGVLSGTHDWADYMGDMQRGWVGLRPVSDVVVKLDSFITPLQFGDTNISLFRQLLIQTQVLAARYRTGDGTGVAGVTPATSCVQDSNQALFIAMQQVRRQIESHPAVVEWVRQNPNSPEALRAKQFVALGRDLEALLTPYGVIRRDWQSNAETLAGIGEPGDFSNNRGLFSGALSWQTMMPRWGHDAVARTFLRHGGQLWFLRPNMLGGDDPRIEPIPPTTLFGGIPVLGRVVQRFADAFATGVPGYGVLPAAGLLAIYAAIAIPWGRQNGILVRQNAFGHPIRTVLHALRLWFVPALVEEVIFRVLLLPHPIEGIATGRWLVWAAIGLGLFVLYHWVLGKTVYRAAQDTLCDRRFLTLVGGAGLLLTALYGITGSLWLIVFTHWAMVLVWIYALGGKARLPGRKAAQRSTPNPQPTS
ncbi:CPBP family intramembrane metalloprotease [Nodosilinea sp. LEGE 07088]|uniref:CPBP family glutamic-type intramembrane protease n=1 Tax=Nodosilinea sp. LEGE 07088 TaxID=2777968 RepID=UPI00187E18E5|nr:CPBP family glutamic-type intramembrane protease [Nodosilinea sp. LEGE 07088]MBE9140080.1 CPBP family intramembrane metalloprotease [Nodosilinea sp. LEGE 07088]